MGVVICYGRKIDIYSVNETVVNEASQCACSLVNKFTFSLPLAVSDNGGIEEKQTTTGTGWLSVTACENYRAELNVMGVVYMWRLLGVRSLAADSFTWLEKPAQISIIGYMNSMPIMHPITQQSTVQQCLQMATEVSPLCAAKPHVTLIWQRRSWHCQ